MPAARLNLFDRLVAAVSPTMGVRRMQARLVLAQYEAAKPGPQRKWRGSSGAPDQLVGLSAAALRNQVRYLERNHDLARGAISTVVNNTIGPNGIGVEFQPRRADGSIHQEYAQALADAWKDWCRHPEVTQQYGWAGAQRMIGRTWVRDGEAFAQRLLGPVPKLDHATRVPYSIELFEPDLVPLDHDDDTRGIRQGIERNTWGRPTGYWLHKGHPEDAAALRRDSRNLKRVSADRMLHVAFRDRIGQLRGVTPFASIINRLEDIKDYEESERIAAKVAAMMTAYVKRASPEGYDPAGMETDEAGNLKPRDLRMSPGMIIDSLAVGEEIGLINNSNRPNPNLVTFRSGQLRAMAAGLGVSYSSLARDYNGTYSAQRQELVEQWVHYAVLSDMFASAVVRPVVEDFVLAADLSGVVPRPADVRVDTEDDVLFVAPSMPWIDPLKEISAHLMAVQAGFSSEYEVLRRQGKNPSDLLAQVVEWRRRTREAGLVFTSDAGSKAATAPAPAPAPAPAEDDPETDDQGATGAPTKEDDA